MHLLVCAATFEELRAFDKEHVLADIEFFQKDDIGFLVTGVGIPFALASVLQAAARERPEHILNIGIAGAYPGSGIAGAYPGSGLAVGGIVTALSEVYGDVGMGLPEAPHFRPLRDTPFGQGYAEPYSLTPWPGARQGRGCTVNCCTGTLATGRLRETLFEADFETMEGAAVAQAGKLLGIPVSEVRSISNIAADRDMRPENIKSALASLARFFQDHSHA